MRMEEELHLAVALSRSLARTDGRTSSSALPDLADLADLADLDDLDELRTPPHVPEDRLHALAPQSTYHAAVAADKKLRGVRSTLPGGGECVVCHAPLLSHHTVRTLAPCRQYAPPRAQPVSRCRHKPNPSPAARRSTRARRARTRSARTRLPRRARPARVPLRRLRGSHAIKRSCFHAECIEPWLRRSTCCPTCRTDLCEADRVETSAA
jgi:hypothetical protein